MILLARISSAIETATSYAVACVELCCLAAVIGAVWILGGAL